MAAPVGVTRSPPTPSWKVGNPRRRRAAAGAGVGSIPWAVRTLPPPRGSGAQDQVASARESMSQAAQTTSAMESHAPTSWNVTSSTGMPCTSASASARRVKMAVAPSATGRESPLSRSHDRISAKRRWGGCAPGASAPARSLPPSPRPPSSAGEGPPPRRASRPPCPCPEPCGWPRPGGSSPLRTGAGAGAPAPDAGVAWKRRPRRMPSVNGSDRTRTISCRRHSASPAASPSARSGKASRRAAANMSPATPPTGSR